MGDVLEAEGLMAASTSAAQPPSQAPPATKPSILSSNNNVSHGDSSGNNGNSRAADIVDVVAAAAAAAAAAVVTPTEASHPPPLAPEPVFPLLQNNASQETLSQTAPAQKRSAGNAAQDDDTDEEPAVAEPFVRTRSPDDHPAASRQDNDPRDEYDARSLTRLFYRMHKFTLYETASRYYIVGGDVTEKRYRILKVDRNTHEPDSELSITDDKIIYSQKEMNSLLDTIDDGNRGTGGIKQRCTTWGLLGFIKFTGPYYMLLITKKSTVAMIGGHYVYQVDGTELIPLTPAKFRPDVRNTEEPRFLGILNNLDLTRSFYYSYSYDITRTLQHNISRERTALANGLPGTTCDDFNSMFVWNSHLLQPVVDALHDPFDWCRPIIHGYIDQAALSIYGRSAYITIIARRSRYFAGARFLKRGANDLGYVANDVETEQIVSESLTTSFHSPGPKLFASPQFTSYVQHRGSIPLYWTQDNIGVTPKPPIELNLVDPFYTAAAQHFNNLFERYGSPIYVLNLVKARERTPRESKLLDEFTNCINYLNQFLPDDNKIIYKAWDMSRAAKSRDQDVIGTLESIAESVVTTTGFFQNGDGDISPTNVQNGVARTNCIDCLDRTNAAQFVIGKRALGHQLHALGILADTSIDYDTDAVNLFTHMYHDHGDTIAVQYGGSQLVNTMETYRKINQWTSHSRDMIESFKRYYNNSFMDSQRQEAYNLFLGNYIFALGQPMLWDLATDYYLHHSDPRAWFNNAHHDYIRWFTPRFLERRSLPAYVPPPLLVSSADASNGDNNKSNNNSKKMQLIYKQPASFFDDYWLEYYRPSTLSSFLKMFPYKMNSTIKYIPFKSTQEGRYDLSPFRVRIEGAERGGNTSSGAGDIHQSPRQKQQQQQYHHDQQYHHHNNTNHQQQLSNSSRKKNSSTTKKEVTIVDPHERLRRGAGGGSGSVDQDIDETESIMSERTNSKGISIHRWLQPNVASEKGPSVPHGIMKETRQRNYSNNNNNSRSSNIYSTGGGVGRNLDAAVMAVGGRKQTPAEKSAQAQLIFAKVVHESLHPSVNAQDMDDYARYISHAQSLPLVVSSNEAPADVDASEYHNYLNGGWQVDGLSTSWANSNTAAASADAAAFAMDGSTMAGTGNTLGGAPSSRKEEDLAAYWDLLRVGDNPLTVTEEDLPKKRYKAYRKWLRGKSLFKQQPLPSESGMGLKAQSQHYVD
ncbi:phosphatidylinositol-3-5-bisphosphate 5-phosphatase [Apiospora kogelbergensis]|uniref:Phosphatidylinositol-3-5-bisphosphate 5-phosphatase n=1 Tax=Apiospora kogelbergensis TaxID=1337665 RepID=A0AAW0QJG2_9PEZI